MRRGLSLLLIVLLPSLAAAQELLPGEMPVEFGRKMIDPERFPTVRELMERLSHGEQEPAIMFRFYADRHNHYAPLWSPDGRALAVLRSDIEAHTSKVVILPSLDADTPVVLYTNVPSYDHMFAWSVSGSHSFAFASTNEPSEQENLHVALLRGQPDPKRVTSGPGVKGNPSLWLDGPRGRLFFSHAGKIESLLLDLDQPGGDQPSPVLGEGTEASFSPDGRYLVWTERTQITATHSNYALRLRDLERNSDQRLATPPGMVLRNPAWSPEGRHLAYYARPAQQPSWRLYVVPAPVAALSDGLPEEKNGERLAQGVGAPLLLAQDLRIQEHFQNIGPSWDPRGDRIWYFAQADEQEYYPLNWVTIDGKRRGQVSYPRRLTTGTDVAVNPNRAFRAIAFCGIEDLHQDVVVLILNHEAE